MSVEHFQSHFERAKFRIKRLRVDARLPHVHLFPDAVRVQQLNEIAAHCQIKVGQIEKRASEQLIDAQTEWRYERVYVKRNVEIEISVTRPDQRYGEHFGDGAAERRRRRVLYAVDHVRPKANDLA